jgi:hypothetical protein
MLKVVENAAWFAAFAFVVAFVAGMAMMASSNHPPNHQGQPSQSERRDSPKREAKTQTSANQDSKPAEKENNWYDIFRERPTDWLLVIFTFLLVAFNFGLWWTTWGLWEAAKEQSSDMKASLVETKRSADAAKDAADAAKAQNKITRDIFVADQRPWISLRSIEPIGDFVFFDHAKMPNPEGQASACPSQSQIFAAKQRENTCRQGQCPRMAVHPGWRSN